VRTVRLERHADSRGDAVRSLSARVGRVPGGGLAVSYAIEGDIRRLHVPAPRPPRFAERLWQHTCCEIFVAAKGRPAYHEFNFSPSGEWAAYAFTGYRQGAPLADPALNPRIEVRAGAGRLELDALIPCGAGSLALGLSAIVEEEDGSLSYWALRHPPGKPDFHHSAAFALELD